MLLLYIRKIQQLEQHNCLLYKTVCSACEDLKVRIILNWLVLCQSCLSEGVLIIFISTGLTTVTMLKVAFVLACLLSFALAHPVSTTLSNSISIPMFLYVNSITINVIV